MRLPALLALSTTLSACGGPYADLEGSFRVAHPASAPAISVKHVVLTSTRATGAHSFDNVLEVKLLPASVELNPTFPFSTTMGTVAIQAHQIAGCSKSCFGDGVWEANLLIFTTGTEISFRNSKEVVDWCWANKIPMISSNDRRQWLYKGANLPDRSKFIEQLSSRELYDAQAKQSCLGY